MGDGSTMAESERDLVRQLQGGERAALEALYRRYVERVWRYAFARTRDREVAADVVQDTFLRVWQRIGTFRGRAQFSTWLFAVARSALVDEVRRRRRASSADASRLDPSAPRVLRLAVMDDAPEAPRRSAAGGSDWEDSIALAEERDAVRAAISRLRPAHREVVVLCELCGMSMRAAAEALNWGESRVKVTLHRARKRLAVELRDLDARQGVAEGE
jgi:RNA polymerase sigma-70 factor (ECF subfamily)